MESLQPSQARRREADSACARIALVAFARDQAPGLALGHQVAHGLLGHASALGQVGEDRKSTRLNSSHLVISYAVFCLKKKKQDQRSGLANIIDFHNMTRVREIDVLLDLVHPYYEHQRRRMPKHRDARASTLQPV